MDLRELKELINRFSNEYNINPINALTLDNYKPNQSSIILILKEGTHQGHYVLYLQGDNPLFVDPYGNYPYFLFRKYPEIAYNVEKIKELFTDLLNDPNIQINTSKVQTYSGLCGPLCLIFYILYEKGLILDNINTCFKRFQEIYKMTVEDYMQKMVNTGTTFYISIRQTINNLFNIYKRLNKNNIINHL